MTRSAHRPQWLSVALAAAGSVVLFVVQFLAIGVGPIPESEWLLHPSRLALVQTIVWLNLRELSYAALPCIGGGYLLGRVLSSGERRTHLPRLLLTTWAVVWTACWLALYLLLGGINVARWSTDGLRTPAVWYGLILVGLGLYMGSRRRHTGDAA